MDFPDPVIELAIEPKTKADQEKLGIALQKLAAEDPSFRVSSDEESGQTIIAGMGELHLDILVDRMKREFNVEANVGAPQVAYRESITRTIETTYTQETIWWFRSVRENLRSLLNQMKKAKALHSNPKSLVARFPRNTSLVLKKASAIHLITARSLASR